jgi:Domain of unknown function (DUF4276)
LKRIVAIVEGYGDNASIPHLIDKLGRHIGQHLIAVSPIRAGEWSKLKRPGELERALILAHGRDCDHILVILDMDDDCAVEEAQIARERVNIWKGGRSIDVSIVFLVREYESLFLSSAESFCQDNGLIDEAVAYADSTRDAKGAIRKLTGRRYKETQDQAEYTKRLNIDSLIQRSRCFRKLLKELSGELPITQ